MNIRNAIKHLKLVLKHKWLVLKFCTKLGMPFRGLMHDLSKFSIEELRESIKYYKGNESPINVCRREKGYSKAWNHHKARNKHHEEYWVDLDSRMVAPVIPYKYVAEMICDKVSASMVYNGKDWTPDKQCDYWEKRKKTLIINPKVEKLLTEVFRQIKDNGLDKTLTKKNIKSLYKKYCIDDKTEYKYEFHGEWKKIELLPKQERIFIMKEEKKATRQSYGEALEALGEKYKDIVVLDADLSEATKTCLFAKKFPERFFDMGIAEANMMATAAGMATTGKKVFASTFAVFAAGRSYDQIRTSICYPNLDVKICATHAGITVGEDGATHQMLEDINMMRCIPNMKVLSPSDDIETKWAIEEAYKQKGPVYVRLSRMATPIIYEETQKFEFGKMIQIGDGTDATIFATGDVVSNAIKAQEELKKMGINIRVIDVHTIKPIDENMIIKCANETKRLISIEDHNIIGGLGSAISEVLTTNIPKKLERMGINDTFGKSGKAEELLNYYKIDTESIVKKFI